MIDNNGYWPYRVEAGDILEDAKGNKRTVISAKQGKSGFTTVVSMPILRCSWTRRPYTTRTYVDLQQSGYKPTGEKLKRLSALMVRLMIEERNVANAALDAKRHLFSWDTVGVLK